MPTTDPDKTVVDVVAAIIFSKNKSSVLLALRKPEQHQGNRWEFPGGKQEPGETLTTALIRELQEELAITPIEFSPYQTLEHRYADKFVRLHFWIVDLFSGEARGCENQKLKWVAVQELAAYRFPDANQVIVDQLVSGV